jgi:DNA polymerase-3 subunit gamma/tau
VTETAPEKVVSENKPPETSISENISKEEVAAKPIATVQRFGDLSLKSKFSIHKKADESGTQSESGEEFSSKANDPFTIDQLRSVWSAYCHLLTKEGKPGLVATLTKNKFSLEENNVIHLTVDNKIQQLELDVRKQHLINYLRVELNNFSLDLKIAVNETVNDVQHLTNKDKFLKMAEKNPLLQSFRERLDLELEY